MADRIRGLETPNETTLVAIDGWGCGGKTSLCEGLLDRLEPNAVYLGLDEFFWAYPFPPLDPFPHQHLRWREIRTTIQDLRTKGVAYPRLFEWDNLMIGEPIEITAGIVIVEGLFSLSPDLRALYDLRIWVQSRVETRLPRVAAQDGAETVDFWSQEWGHREAALFAKERPWEAADIVVAGAEISASEIGGMLRDASKYAAEVD